MSDRVVSLDQKLKGKLEDPPTLETNLEELLTLRLGNNNTSSKLLKASEVSGYSSSKHVQESQYPFPCKYCEMKFPNFQTLGGHIKNHEHKTNLLKWGKELSLKPLGAPMKNPSPFKSPGLRHLTYANMLYRVPLGQASNVNYHGPNRPFTTPSSQLNHVMNGLFGRGVGRPPKRLNHVVDQPKLNLQVPPFALSEAHNNFQAAPIPSAPVQGLGENAIVPANRLFLEELDLSLTLKR